MRCVTVGFITYLMRWAAALKISAQSCVSGKDIPEDKGLHGTSGAASWGDGRQPRGCLQVAVPPDTWNPRLQMTASALVCTCPVSGLLSWKVSPAPSRRDSQGEALMHRAAPLCRT